MMDADERGLAWSKKRSHFWGMCLSER